MERNAAGGVDLGLPKPPRGIELSHREDPSSSSKGGEDEDGSEEHHAGKSGAVPVGVAGGTVPSATDATTAAALGNISLSLPGDGTAVDDESEEDHKEMDDGYGGSLDDWLRLFGDLDEGSTVLDSEPDPGHGRRPPGEEGGGRGGRRSRRLPGSKIGSSLFESSGPIPSAEEAVRYELNYDLTPQRLRRFYRRYDRNHDGKLSFEELVVGLSEFNICVAGDDADFRRNVLSLVQEQEEQTTGSALERSVLETRLEEDGISIDVFGSILKRIKLAQLCAELQRGARGLLPLSKQREWRESCQSTRLLVIDYNSDRLAINMGKRAELQQINSGKLRRMSLMAAESGRRRYDGCTRWGDPLDLRYPLQWLPPSQYVPFFFSSRPRWADQRLGGDGVRFVVLESDDTLDIDMMLRLATKYSLHPLAVEDVLNTANQGRLGRQKVDKYGDHFFVSLQMFEWKENTTLDEWDPYPQYGVAYCSVCMFIAGPRTQNVSRAAGSASARSASTSHDHEANAETDSTIPGPNVDEEGTGGGHGKDLVIAVHQRKQGLVGNNSGWAQYMSERRRRATDRQEHPCCCCFGSSKDSVRNRKTSDGSDDDNGSEQHMLAGREIWVHLYRKLRHEGTLFRDSRGGHLVFETVDAVVDSMTPVMAHLRKKVHGLHKSLLKDKHQFQKNNELSHLNSILFDLGRHVKPLHQVVRALVSEPGLCQGLEPFLDDVDDHITSTMDEIDSFIRLCGVMANEVDRYSDRRMNSTLYFLTVFTAITTFPMLAAGVFGMNFVNRDDGLPSDPMLTWQYGYAVFWIFCFVSVVLTLVVMVLYTNGWFRVLQKRCQVFLRIRCCCGGDDDDSREDPSRAFAESER